MTSSLRTLLVDARAVDHPTARHRGVGRHVAGLLRGLTDIDAPVIGLYGGLGEVERLADVAPELELRPWSRAVVRDHAEPGTWYLATQLMLHPIALDPIPEPVTACRLPVAALMYDVMPQRFPELYLRDEAPRRQVRLRRALAGTVDLMLANSVFVADTAADELDYPRDRIHVVGAAPDPLFTPGNGEGTDQPLPIVAGTYAVAVTGADERKNTHGLIRAWALAERGDARLVVVAGPSQAAQRAWQALADELGVGDEIVFTGAIDDHEMLSLLRGARLAIVPSIEEGFGLPVVEAAATGCPVICSGTSSLPEVLVEPETWFDPLDPASMAEVIGRGLRDEHAREQLVTAAAATAVRWTWRRVAHDVIAAIEAAGPRWSGTPRRVPSRVAVAGDELRTRLGADHPEVVDPWPVRSLGRTQPAWNIDHLVVEPELRADPTYPWDAIERSVPVHVVDAGHDLGALVSRLTEPDRLGGSAGST